MLGVDVQVAAAKRAAAPGDLLTASMLQHGGKADAIAAGAAASAAAPVVGIAVAGQPAIPEETAGSGLQEAETTAAGGTSGPTPPQHLQPGVPPTAIKHIVTVGAPAAGSAPGGSKQNPTPATAEAADTAASRMPTTAGTLSGSSGDLITPAPATDEDEHSRMSQTSDTPASPRGESRPDLLYSIL
jgi:hypothetical protein